MKYHAFYSRKQERLIASEVGDYAGKLPVYRLTDGSEQVCTELKDKREGHNFEDSIYLGEVEVPGNHLGFVKARE